MISWEASTLGEVLEFQRGHDLPSGQRTPGEVPIIGSFGVTGYHNEARYCGPGVAIGRSGAAIGTATFVESAYWPLNTCLFVRDFKDNDPRWVFRLLDLTDFLAYNSGSAQPSLNRNFLRNIPVCVPPLREQEAVSEVLEALDRKIVGNAKLVATAEALMVSIASTAAQHVSVTKIARQSTRSLQPEQFDEQVAHFSLPAFDADARPDIADRASIKSNKLVVDSPLVMVSKLNPRIPRIWDVPKALDLMALASTEFVPLKPIEVGSSELWSVLAQPEVTATLTGKVAGTSGSHQRVKPADVLALYVRDPRTLDESRRRALVSLGLIRHERRSESAGLAAMRDALLPLLMSGKIRVKDAEGVVEGMV